MATTAITPPGAFRVSPNSPVFDLPFLVAREEGLFAKAGLDVDYAAKLDERGSERDVFSRLREGLFERAESDAFNVCEWGGIDRAERGTRGGQVLSLRGAVVAMALVTFDAELQEAADLGGIPVGINERTGSHYNTLLMLDGPLERDRIEVEHVGSPERRYAALKGGEVRVATLMEPYISLALKEGAHVLATSFFRGAEVVAPDRPAEQRQAYLDALDEAVDRINADPDRYRHFVVAPTDGALEPEELRSDYARYGHVQPYPEERFAKSYEWMRSWGLAEGEGDHARLVV